MRGEYTQQCEVSIHDNLESFVLLADDVAKRNFDVIESDVAAAVLHTSK